MEDMRKEGKIVRKVRDFLRQLAQRHEFFLKSLTVKRSPDGVLLEQAHGLEIVVGVKGETVVDSSRLEEFTERVSLTGKSF